MEIRWNAKLSLQKFDGLQNSHFHFLCGEVEKYIFVLKLHFSKLYIIVLHSLNSNTTILT